MGTQGRAAIAGNFTLNQKLKPLLDLLDANAKKAQETAQLKAQVAHETEAGLLAKMKQNIADAVQNIPTVAGTPLVGAHAPGQGPVPAGALPLSVVPQPQHPKPARRGGKPKPPSKPKQNG